MKIKNSLRPNTFGRRQFLSGSMASAATLSLRSLATGLPAGFLLAGHMPAYGADTGVKKLILGMSDDGESFNSYAPGTYSNNANDPRSLVERATASELGTDSRGTINGNSVTVNDFANSAIFQMGDAEVEGARYLSYLPQALLDRMSIFHLRTSANGHPEGDRVHAMNGALVSPTGRGSEEIQSAIMQEVLQQDVSATSVLSTPMVLNGGGGRLATLNYDGVAITRYSPLDVKNLFLTSSNATIDNMNKVYESTIDAIYKSIKVSGTPAQQRYLDAHAASRAQASALGDQLGDLLTDVTGSTRGDQLKAAVAMAKANLAPVIVIRYAYSRDNHGDEDLADEVTTSIEQMNNLESFWSLVQAEGLEDQVNYATYDIFGRTMGRNSRGGRDHHNSSCVNMMIGSNIKAGVIGGVEEWPKSGHRLLRATGINSATGLSDSPDVSGPDTLTAYGRTLMASVGISEERINARIPSGKTVTGALNI